MAETRNQSSDGARAFAECDGSLRDKVVAWFNAEPQAKAHMIAKGRTNADRVAGILRGEEQRYLDLLDRAPAIVAKWFRNREVNGVTLAKLYNTHGLDITVVESVLGNFTSEVHAVFDVHKKFNA